MRSRYRGQVRRRRSSGPGIGEEVVVHNVKAGNAEILSDKLLFLRTNVFLHPDGYARRVRKVSWREPNNIARAPPRGVEHPCRSSPWKLARWFRRGASCVDVVDAATIEFVLCIGAGGEHASKARPQPPHSNDKVAGQEASGLLGGRR